MKIRVCDSINVGLNKKKVRLFEPMANISDLKLAIEELKTKLCLHHTKLIIHCKFDSPCKCEICKEIDNVFFEKDVALNSGKETGDKK